MEYEIGDIIRDNTTRITYLIIDKRVYFWMSHSPNNSTASNKAYDLISLEDGYEYNHYGAFHGWTKLG